MTTIAVLTALALIGWTLATAYTLRRDRRRTQAAQVAEQVDLAMAPSRQRHPSAR